MRNYINARRLLKIGADSKGGSGYARRIAEAYHLGWGVLDVKVRGAYREDVEAQINREMDIIQRAFSSSKKLYNLI